MPLKVLLKLMKDKNTPLTCTDLQAKNPQGNGEKRQKKWGEKVNTIKFCVPIKIK